MRQAFEESFLGDRPIFEKAKEVCQILADLVAIVRVHMPGDSDDERRKSDSHYPDETPVGRRMTCTHIGKQIQEEILQGMFCYQIADEASRKN